MKKPKEAPTTVVRHRGDDDPIGRGNYLNVTSKRMLLRILYLFKIGLLCINSRSNLAKKKFRNVHHKVAMVFGCAESTIQKCVKENESEDGLLEPSQRGGKPWENIDIAPLEHTLLNLSYRSTYTLCDDRVGICPGKHCRSEAALASAKTSWAL